MDKSEVHLSSDYHLDKTVCGLPLDNDIIVIRLPNEMTCKSCISAYYANLFRQCFGEPVDEELEEDES